MTNALGFPDYALTNPGPQGGSATSITFNSGTADANGTYWTLDGSVEGWDAPEMRGALLNKIGIGPQADGVSLADLHYLGRPLKFCLYAESPTAAARDASRYLLAQVLDLVEQPGTFWVGESPPKQLSVYRNPQSKPIITELGFSAVASRTHAWPGVTLGAQIFLLKAEVELYAPDPRKYAPSPTVVGFSGSGVPSIVNPGNTETQNFTLQINSGIAGTAPFTLGLASRSMTFAVPTLPTPPGAPPPIPAGMLIDFYNKLIQDLSANNYYYLRVLTTPWLIIPPGTSALSHSVPMTGSVSFYPAWI